MNHKRVLRLYVQQAGLNLHTKRTHRREPAAKWLDRPMLTVPNQL